jgi:plastocyanin
VKPLIAALAGAALISAAPAHGAARKTVSVGDNYFTPQTLTVRPGTTITWRWPGYDQAGDVHDIALISGPRGVRRFRSEAASTDYRYSRKLTVPGTYRLGCSLHHEMRMTVKVRKAG